MRGSQFRDEARDYLVAGFLTSALPEPPHFSQFIPALAAAMQHSWVQVLPSFTALAQHAAALASLAGSLAPKATPAVSNEPTINATRVFLSFMFFWG